MRPSKILVSLGLALLSLGPIGGARGEDAKKTATHVGDLGATDDLDLRDIVFQAVKAGARVQEAPAILSVITGSQLEDMGYRTVSEALDSIPGFMSYRWVYGNAPTAFPSGILHGMIALNDGLDVYHNMTTGSLVLNESIPIELVKSIELTSGPAGVLWGSNSFVGMINLVSKTADDLNGIEASAGYGTGPGRPSSFRAYAMAGQKFFKDRLKLLVHASYETWRQPETEVRFQSIIKGAPPAPAGPFVVAGPAEFISEPSQVVTLNGNLQMGSFGLYWHVPFGIMKLGSGLNGHAVSVSLPEDSLDCTNPANQANCQARVDPFRYSRDAAATMFERYGMLKYGQSFANDKLRLEGRAFYVQHMVLFEPISIFAGSQQVPNGLVLENNYYSHRVGANIDGNWSLPWESRLLFGGEVFLDYVPEVTTDWQVPEETLNIIPVRCPRDANGHIIRDSEGRFCPVTALYQTDRLTGGMFLMAQTRLIPNVVLEAGGRLQVFGGKRSLSPEPLVSGGLVWSPGTDWNVKVNYTEGFRPPSLVQTDANGDTITWGGNPFLDVERSRAVQGELNAVLLRGQGALQSLNWRGDYSYSRISNYITVRNGLYQNTSEMAIHRVESLLDLRLKAGHWLTLAYTFLDATDSAMGKLRSLPSQWMKMQAVFNLWKHRLLLASNLTVMGSAEDFNRIPGDSRGEMLLGELDSTGKVVGTPIWSSAATDVVRDRIPPVAIWNAGVRYMLPKYGLRFDGDVYNLLNAKSYYGEAYMDPTAFVESAPQPRQGISFFLRATYTH